jgi:hypothetical protein
MSDEPAKIILGDTAIAATEGGPARRWFGRRKIQKPPPFSHCQNCGAELRGHWCSQCGQAAVDYHRSFRHVILDVLDEFLSWDSKIFATIGLLIAKPWRLTNEFLAGKRIRYVHPLRLYLLASILFFFGATYAIKSSHFQPLNLSPADRVQIRSELGREDIPADLRTKIEQALEGRPIAPKKRAALEEQVKNTALPQEARDAIQELLDHGNLPENPRAKIEEAMKDVSPEMREKVEQSLKKASEQHVIFESEKNDQPNDLGKWFKKRAREKFGEHGTNIQLFLLTLMSNLPYMMLACIPLFAFVFKILYIRRGVFYIEHLIYALHIHTFAYIGVMLLVFATIGINRAGIGTLGGWIIAAIWTAFAVQILLSIRKVYRQGWFFSLFKFFFGGFIYLIVLVLGVAATFLATLALP